MKSQVRLVNEMKIYSRITKYESLTNFINTEGNLSHYRLNKDYFNSNDEWTGGEKDESILDVHKLQNPAWMCQIILLK